MFGPGAGRQRPSCLSTSALVEAGWGGWWAWVALVCHLLAPHEPAAFLRGALPLFHPVTSPLGLCCST